MSTYLAIDYGRKHLGLAVADGPLATPLPVIDYDSLNSVYLRLTQIISDQGIDKVVIGLPEGELDREIRAFGTKLSSLAGIEVEYHPETLSSVRAVNQLKESGKKVKDTMAEHSYAACLILEDYLETLSR